MKNQASPVQKPTIAMCDFFALAVVKACQQVQMQNPYRSAAHRKAHDDMKALAATYGAQSFFGDY